MKKRIFSLILALILVFSCSTTAFAAGPNAPAGEVSTSSVSSSDWVIGGPYVGYTSTSPNTGTFTYAISPAKMRIRVDLSVDGPVSMFLRIYDSNGQLHGSSTFTAPYAGSWSWSSEADKMQLGPGTYTWEIFFSESGVYCIYTVIGVTVV